MPLDESSSELCHALARAFCVVGGWESVINNAKLLDIDVALSRCAAFANISDSERHTILKDAAAVIKREGMEGMGNAMEVVGSQHGREMLEVMLQLLMTWETCLPDKKQLMWHLNTDVGVTMDEYYAMWQRIANAPRKTFANSQQKEKPRTTNQQNDTMSEQASNDDPRWKNELHLLEQYADEVGGILNQLAEADSGRAKGLQKQLKQRMEILKKQVDLISRDFPNADGEKICRACYMTLEARSLMLSSGMLRRLSDTARRGIPGGVPIPLKILKGVIALITGFAAKQHEKGNAGKGIELLNRSIAIFDAPDARFLKATVLFDLGDKTGAVSELNHILKNFPDDEHYVLARKLKDEIENPPKKGFCFVATAAYGSPMAQEVVLLSRFRDEVLLHSKLGRLFVAFYYWLSPPIAAIIARFGFLRAATRKLFLSPLLQILKSRNAKLKPGL